ncbi:MAG: hypothetical protein NTW87_25135, partial [Planctomycetota bacterium]|nr:hypothetical protein [Planctomycetota bacterium]
MLQDFLIGCKSIMARYGDRPCVATQILNDLYGPALKVYGVGTVVATSAEQVTLTVHGRLAKGTTPKTACLSRHPKTVDLCLDSIGKAGLKSAA